MIPFHPLFDSFEVIAHGSSSTIYKAIHLPTNTTVTLKSIYQSNGSVQNEYIQREINIHRSIDHPFITSFFGEYNYNKQQVLVLEFMKGQTLLDAINKSGGMNQYDANRVFCQIVSAIKYLHKDKKISHQNLKLENVIINFQGNIKLIDFGFPYINFKTRSLHKISNPYIAPEISKVEEYTLSADIWSLGVMLYGMISGKLPFENSCNTSISQSVPKDPSTICIECIPDEIKGLITGMLEPDPSKRFTIDQVENHGWVQLHSFKNLIKPEFYKKAELLTYPPNQILDPNVLNLMKKYNIDYSLIDPEKFETDFSDSLMAYKMIKNSIISSKFGMIYLKAIMDSSSNSESSGHSNSSNAKLPTLYLQNESSSIVPNINDDKNSIEKSINQEEFLHKLPPISFTMKSVNRPNIISMPQKIRSSLAQPSMQRKPKIISNIKLNPRPTI